MSSGYYPDPDEQQALLAYFTGSLPRCPVCGAPEDEDCVPDCEGEDARENARQRQADERRQAYLTWANEPENEEE